MSNHIFEEGPRRGHAAGNTSLEQQASQLTSDIKYKARQKMKGTSGSSMSPGQVQQLYRQLLGSSSAPGGVKAIVKKKLFKEQIDTGVVSVSEHVKDSSSYVYSRVFSEAEERKFVVRVTDRATGNTSYRKADRAKISELRANKNISSVEITGRKEVDDAYKGDPKPNYGEKNEKKYGSSKGKNTVGDKDGDGTKEPDRHEYAGVKDKAIKKAMAKEEYIDEAPYQVMGSPDGKKEKKIGKPVKSRKYADSRAAELADTHKKTGGQYRSKYVEEVIYEKDDNGEKKLDVMKKGKNNVKINPSLGESIRAELDLLKAQRIAEQDASMKQQDDEKKKEQLADQQAKKDKQMKLRIIQSKKRALMGGAEIAASHELEGDTIAEGEACMNNKEGEDCPVQGKGDCSTEDPRSMPAKINLAKNKLRAMGLKMSYDMQGDMVEATEDSLKDRRMERGGVDGNIRYDKAPSNTSNTFGKKKPVGGPSALERVKTSITDKYGKGAIMGEAKYESGASNYGKMSIRNKRAVGYGGNAAPPEERRKAHQERMKKHMGKK